MTFTNTSDPIALFGFQTAGQIRFGRGAAAAHIQDVARFGRRVLLIRGRSVAWVDGVADQLAACGCSVVTVVAQGEPTVADVDAATTLGRQAGADVVVAIGGGAVIDLGKGTAAMIPATGILLDHLEGVGGGQPLVADPLPFVAIPTTAGTGSEVTKNAVIAVPDRGRKVSLRDDRMIPRLALVDPALTDGTPDKVTFASGLDAVTQVIEPYLSNRANPLTDALCRGAIPMGLTALAQLAKAETPQARDQIAYVSLIGGIALANAGLGAVHGLAGVMGGRFGAPHGLICGRLLGPVLRMNQDRERASNHQIDRYIEIAGWMAAAFDMAPESAFYSLPAWLDARSLARLSNWIGADADIEAMVAEAISSSSMKANPNVPSTSDLINAVAKTL